MQTAERANGIILRTRPFTETSLIVNWITPDLGRIHTVAKGARRSKSPLRGKLDLFYEADFSFQRSRRSELHTLREVVLRETHPTLRREIEWLQQASYCSALVEQATERETPLPEIFVLMRGFLAALPVTPPQPQSVFAFELKLLNELGLQPDLNQTHLTPGAKHLITALGEKDWSMIAHVKLSAAQALELQRFLHGFLIFHLGRIPKGRPTVSTPH